MKMDQQASNLRKQNKAGYFREVDNIANGGLLLVFFFSIGFLA